MSRGELHREARSGWRPEDAGSAGAGRTELPEGAAAGSDGATLAAGGRASGASGAGAIVGWGGAMAGEGSSFLGGPGRLQRGWGASSLGLGGGGHEEVRGTPVAPDKPVPPDLVVAAVVRRRMVVAARRRSRGSLEEVRISSRAARALRPRWVLARWVARSVKALREWRRARMDSDSAKSRASCGVRERRSMRAWRSKPAQRKAARSSVSRGERGMGAAVITMGQP